MGYRGVVIKGQVGRKGDALNGNVIKYVYECTQRNTDRHFLKSKILRTICYMMCHVLIVHGKTLFDIVPNECHSI